MRGRLGPHPIGLLRLTRNKHHPGQPLKMGVAGYHPGLVGLGGGVHCRVGQG
jgi:hypothetical protein